MTNFESKKHVPKTPKLDLGSCGAGAALIIPLHCCVALFSRTQVIWTEVLLLSFSNLPTQPRPINFFEVFSGAAATTRHWSGTHLRNHTKSREYQSTLVLTFHNPALLILLRHKRGFYCASFDRDYGEREMDFVRSAGFLFLGTYPTFPIGLLFQAYTIKLWRHSPIESNSLNLS